MAQSSPFEAQVFVDTYPSGKSWARDLDNFMRELLSAIKARLNDEHLWLNVGDEGYDADAAGKHRPSSARAWVMNLDASGIPVFEFGDYDALSAALQDSLDNALIAFKTTNDATPTQMLGRWEGSTWVIHNGKLRPLIHKLRGAVDLLGLMRFGPVKNSYHGQLLNGIPVDENLGTLRPQADVPQPLSDAHTYEAYYTVTYQERTDGDTFKRVIYPVRIGNFDKYGKNRKPDDDASSYALMWEINNSDEQGTGLRTEWLRMYLTARGLEFVSGPSERSIFFNGVDIFNHDHSGDAGMGKPFDWSKATGDTTALTYSKHIDATSERVISGGITPANAVKEIFRDEASNEFAPNKIYPVDADGNVENLQGKMRMFQFELGASINASYDANRVMYFIVAAEAEDGSYSAPSMSAMPRVIGCFAFTPRGLSGGSLVGPEKVTLTAVLGGEQYDLAPANGKLHFYISAGTEYADDVTAKLSMTVTTWRR